MRKIKCMIFIMIFFCFIGCFSFAQATALDDLGSGYDPGKVQTGTLKPEEVESEAMTDIKSSINKVFGIFFTIMQVTSIAAVVFVGVSYMLASAENKAVLKQKLAPLIIGIIIVFGASTVVSFVIKTFTEITAPIKFQEE